MSYFGRILRVIHQRALWQALLVYLGVSYAVLEAVDLFIDRFGMPSWLFPLAFTLLLAGLPVILVTTFVQTSGDAARRSDPTLLPDAVVEPAAAAAGRPGTSQRFRQLFSWRNAIVGGVAAFALWGVVTAGWLLAGFPGLFLVKAEAAEFFNAKDRVVVAEFENDAGQEALGLAVREAIVTDLDQSEYLGVAGRSELVEVLKRMRLPDTTTVDPQVAVEIARREGYPAVIAGSVSKLGTGYQLTARILETASGDVAVRVRETAASESDVVAAVERLSRLVRRHLGESLTSLQRSVALPQVTTESLEALELFARGVDYARRGANEAAIPLLERAVALDTSFATAYRALSIYHGNSGNVAAAQRYVDRAYAHSSRLAQRERYLVGAQYHALSFRLDSAAYYYELEMERDAASGVAINNLADLYERMGRYEEAMPLYRRAVELSPDGIIGYINVASLARTLGQRATADSALAVLLERFPDSGSTKFMATGQPIYFDDFPAAEAVALKTLEDPSDIVRLWGHWFMSSLPAARGDMETTLFHGDSAIELGSSTGVTLATYLALLNIEYALLAAGTPERALPYIRRVEKIASQETTPLAMDYGLAFAANGYALAGDVSAARRLLARLDSLIDSTGLHPTGAEAHVRAVIALQENRPEDALEHLRAARRDAFGLLRGDARLMLGDTYAALGRWPEAAANYDTLTRSLGLNFLGQGLYPPLRPLAHERAASAYLTLGDTTTALRHLKSFVEFWQNADPELQPRIEAARRLMSELLRERG